MFLIPAPAHAAPSPHTPLPHTTQFTPLVRLCERELTVHVRRHPEQGAPSPSLALFTRSPSPRSLPHVRRHPEQAAEIGAFARAYGFDRLASKCKCTGEG